MANRTTDDTTENVTENISFTAVQATFTIEGFDPKRHRWNRWIQRMEDSFKLFNINEDLKVQYLLHYNGMEA